MLGDFLRQLVEERPELEIRILIWSAAIVHAPSEPTQLLIGGEWDKHERINLKLDTFHPIYGAHHQKVVVIDNSTGLRGRHGPHGAPLGLPPARARQSRRA